MLELEELLLKEALGLLMLEVRRVLQGELVLVLGLLAERGLDLCLLI